MSKEAQDYSFLWDDNPDPADYIAGMQSLIDTGDAWRLEGSVGRAAMDLIRSGKCMLGPVGHRNYYGGYVPSRDEVVPGTMGSKEYMEMMSEKEM